MLKTAKAQSKTNKSNIKTPKKHDSISGGGERERVRVRAKVNVIVVPLKVIKIKKCLFNYPHKPLVLPKQAEFYLRCTRNLSPICVHHTVTLNMTQNVILYTGK